jgi:hypothetical protein
MEVKSLDILQLQNELAVRDLDTDGSHADLALRLQVRILPQLHYITDK